MKKLTVICITYNHEPFIRNALEGFVHQKTDFPYEVWVVDDCSTDNNQAVIKEYSLNYPDIIKPTLRNKNVGAWKNTLDTFLNVDTKYIAHCEGDDHWCNYDFVQRGLEFLEENQDCTIFAGNTIYYDHTKNEKKKLVGDILPKPANSCFSLGNNIYLHPSARIMRNLKPLLLGDLFTYHYLLSRGNCYYSDEIFSVYNITGEGSYSKLSEKQQQEACWSAYYALNKHFLFKYDDYYSSFMPCQLKKYKKYFGKILGWYIFSWKRKIPKIKIIAAEVNK